VEIVMHCNLRPSDAAPVLILFNYDVYAKSEVAQPICCCLIALLLLIHYVTLWPWPLTFDSEHCAVFKLSTKFEHSLLYTFHGRPSVARSVERGQGLTQKHCNTDIRCRAA